MKWSYLGNNLVFRKTHAPPILESNIANEGDETISVGSAFQGLTTRILKENAYGLVCVWGLRNIK